MLLPELKPLSKSDYEISKDNERKRKVQHDIAMIDEALESGDEQNLKSTHQTIDGKYHAYIPNWGYGMYSYLDKYGFNYTCLGISSIRHNLAQMKANLEGFIQNDSKSLSSKAAPVASSVSVNISNQLNVNITFEQARAQIEDITSLTDEQTQEILAKITEIEQALNEDGSKKSKWEKVKPVLVWLADKSFDVGMTLLPLLLKLQSA